MLGLGFDIMLDLLVLVAMESLVEAPAAEAALKGYLRRLVTLGYFSAWTRSGDSISRFRGNNEIVQFAKCSEI
jgi:hypothetical protein